ncbi:MAG: hypothetical protein GY723_05150 [bacterium]|nr:hypothetical protein [bacterium]
MRALALFLTVLTGFSGLVYEVAWQKILAILLGSHSEATAAVLAIYLGGLAAGYALFGIVTRRREQSARARGASPHLLRLYGIIEMGIGVWALIFPWLFTGAQMLSVRVPIGNEAVSFAFDVLLTILLIGPPTVLMGGTIPILTQSLAGDLESATRVHAWIYAFNTAGAFVGALAGGFILVPLLGLDGVVRSMALVNLAAGAIFFVLGGGEGLQPDEAAPPGRGTAAFAGYAAVVMLAGFAMMTIQTVLNRIGALSFGASHFTFAMVVAVFVLCIALGSFGVSALSRIPRAFIVISQWVLVALLAGLYLLIPDAPYWAHVLRTLFSTVGAAFYPYFLAIFSGLLAVLIIPIGLAGALLPLLFYHLRNEIGDLGSVAGKLYSWNTLGSLVGALLGGYALLFWLDLHQVFVVALAALVLAAALITWLVGRVPLPISAALGAAAVVLLMLLPDWSPEQMGSGLFRSRAPVEGTYLGPREFFAKRNPRIDFHTDDPIATVSVLNMRPQGQGLARAIKTNGKADGSMGIDYPTMAIAGLLPALLSDDPSRAFVIGWGTGVTVGELAALPETRDVVVAEISPGVIEAAPLFDYGNQRASKSPKVAVLRSDAYRALLHSEGRYGLVVSEPSNPWVAGVEMLFSREFLEAARARLTPGGVYAQWIHLYEIDRRAVTTVLRTYVDVFDSIGVWYTYGPDLLLLGFNDPTEIDLERMRRRFEMAGFTAGFERAKISSFNELLVHEVLPQGTPNVGGLVGPLHTLRHPILSDQAARAFFRGREASLPSFTSLGSARLGAGRSLLRRNLPPAGGPAREAALAEASAHAVEMVRPLEAAALLSAWSHEYPDSAAAGQAVARYGPSLEKQGKVEGLLDKLRTLHGDPASASSGNSLARARETTLLFERYYHHAVPFSRHALEIAWRSCAAAGRDADRCAREAHALVQRLGPLGEEALADR